MQKNKYHLKRDREIMLTPASWVGKSYSSNSAEEIYGTKINWTKNIFRNGRFWGVHLQSEIEEVENFIASRMFSDNTYFREIANENKRRKKILFKLFVRLRKIDYQKESTHCLLGLANEIMKNNNYYESANILSWAYSSDCFQKMVFKKLNIPLNDFLVLSTPKTKTAVSQLEEQLLLKAQKVALGEEALENASRELSEKYGWLAHGWDGPDFWDEKYFAKKISQVMAENVGKYAEGINKIRDKDLVLENKKQEIAKKHGLSFEDQVLVNKLNAMAVWTDERRGLTFYLYYFYNTLLMELGRRFGLPYKNLKYLLTEELEQVPIDPERIKAITDERINDRIVLNFSNDSYYFLNEKEKQALMTEIEAEQKIGKLTGEVASEGDKKIYKARVKALMSPKESGKVETGDFIVATMTTPDYITAMDLAGGFITDEGGVTCHAAITAREMNKPCVIGTEHATKIFKDNDWAEVNTETGEVRKINQVEEDNQNQASVQKTKDKGIEENISKDKLVYPLRDLAKEDVLLAGGKGASLGEMMQTGFPVPSGFVITAKAFSQFLLPTIAEEIKTEINKINYTDTLSLENASEIIRRKIENQEIPEEIKQAVRAEYKKLNAKFVAVRSSATAEDSLAASWAGELESYLDVTEENLFNRIKQCWSSLFTPRALVYRYKKGLVKKDIAVSVVVQTMLTPQASGVCFSVHPVTKNPEQMIIEAVWGLGEGLVSGAITPDSYVIDKNNWQVIGRRLTSQEKEISRLASGGTAWQSVSENKKNRPKLSEGEIIALAKLCGKIEKHYERPQDIEWGLENGKFYILQSRPITTL